MNLKKYVLMMLVIVLLAAIVVVFGAAGCKAAPEDKKIKMGMSFLNTSIPIANSAIKMVKAAAAALDVELIVLDDEFNPEKQVSNIENLIASGVDAAMICNSSEPVVTKMIKTTLDGKVPFGLFFRQINDPGIKQEAADSEYFVGYTHENETNNGYQLGKALAEKGGTKAVMITWNRGDATAEERWGGYVKAFEEFGVEVLAEQWDVLTGDKAAATVESYLAAYPELDIVVVVGGGGENTLGAISSIRNAGRTEDTLFATTDFVPDQLEMLKKGEIDAISGGHWVDPFFQFMLLYNAASGHPLTDEPIAEVIVNYLFITSEEMQMQYDEWIGGDSLPYNDEEIRNLAVKYNPDMDFETLLKWADAYSIEDVMSRHQ